MRDRTGQLRTHLLLIGQSASCSSGSTLAIAEHVCSFALKSSKRGHIPTRSFKSCSANRVRKPCAALRSYGSALAIAEHVCSFALKSSKRGHIPTRSFKSCSANRVRKPCAASRSYGNALAITVHVYSFVAEHCTLEWLCAV